MHTGKRVKFHAIVFIISICCLVIAGAAYIRRLLLEPARLTRKAPSRLARELRVTQFEALNRDGALGRQWSCT